MLEADHQREAGWVDPGLAWAFLQMIEDAFGGPSTTPERHEAATRAPTPGAEQAAFLIASTAIYKAATQGFSDQTLKEAISSAVRMVIKFPSYLRVVGLDDSATVGRYHVDWAGGAGATFTVRMTDDGYDFSFSLDPGISDDKATYMLIEQALGELQQSLGVEPSLEGSSLRYESPRPSWMPPFNWNPPLRRPDD